MLNLIYPIFLVVEPFILYFPSPSACLNHLLQVFPGQFYVGNPLELMQLLRSGSLRLISVAVHVRFFLFAGTLLDMVDVFSPTSFFPYPFYGLCSSSTCNPGIILGQDFLTACLMGQDILPAMAPADFHDWLNRVKRIPLQTDGQPRVIPAQSVQQPFGRIEFTIVLADILVFILNKFGVQANGNPWRQDKLCLQYLMVIPLYTDFFSVFFTGDGCYKTVLTMFFTEVEKTRSIDNDSPVFSKQF